jgi:hypothetical protein
LAAWLMTGVLAAAAAGAQSPVARPMLVPAPGSAFAVVPLLTTGERLGDYRPPGVMDGIAAFRQADGSVRLLVAHELDAGAGYPYQLRNGTTLTGARISWFELDPVARRLTQGGQAIQRAYDRASREVRSPQQVNERRRGGSRDGFSTFCSANGYRAGELGFADDIFFAHEEVSVREGHPHGGSVWALEVATGTLYAAPALGRGSWENSVALATPDADRADGHTAVLLGDDLEFGGAPLYLWIGRRQPGGGFLARNGLAEGVLHVWVADGGDREPGDWVGSGSARSGRFMPLPARDGARAGQPGHDAAGWLNDDRLRERAWALGAFRFSRPEDLAANPADRRQVVFASTGHGKVFPGDEWGGLYIADVRFAAAAGGGLGATATITLAYDGDETRQSGIRSPDNLDWARDGRIYVQEDKAVKRSSFTGDAGWEASIWQFDPQRPLRPQRIAVIDRAAVPAGTTDAEAGEPGEWESSGILDLSGLLGGDGETVLVAAVQAHSVKDGVVGGARELVEAGQLLLLSSAGSGGEARPATRVPTPAAAAPPAPAPR